MPRDGGELEGRQRAGRGTKVLAVVGIAALLALGFAAGDRDHPPAPGVAAPRPPIVYVPQAG